MLEVLAIHAGLIDGPALRAEVQVLRSQHPGLRPQNPELRPQQLGALGHLPCDFLRDVVLQAYCGSADKAYHGG
jgi:hypothetical protein